MSSRETIYTVGEVTAFVRHLLESAPELQAVSISGEVSNLTYHGSGHVYFTIKDDSAQLSCVMFRAYAQYAPRMQAGDRIIAAGSMTVYPPRGYYQLMVRSVRKEGLGDLYQRFVALKDRLKEEGLFDESRKKPVPAVPRVIAVITSPTGAALRDILQTLERRWGIGRVIVIPATVQGEQGADSIVQALSQAQATPAEVIILARGGGSLEDLWNFNEERVARAIVASRIPVITGIGHETDVTIADFAADLRASTPTAAAERVAPDRDAVYHTLDEYETQLARGLRYYIDFKRQVLDDYSRRLEQAVRQLIRDKRQALDLLFARLQAQDITALLRQGYTLTLHQGRILRSAAEIQPGDQLTTIFTDGRVTSQVENSPKPSGEI
ncbi:MAG: exodeoxyribonuclease VII large subunit [Bacteroidia bacterium]|nr:exodeoxyribonuclease VII large subunit [Bacteroidia bacterium]